MGFEIVDKPGEVYRLILVGWGLGVIKNANDVLMQCQIRHISTGILHIIVARPDLCTRNQEVIALIKEALSIEHKRLNEYVLSHSKYTMKILRPGGGSYPKYRNDIIDDAYEWNADLYWSDQY